MAEQASSAAPATVVIPELNDVSVTSAPKVQQSTFGSYFTKESINECKKQWVAQCEGLKDFDVKASKAISKFKEENIMSLGDLRVRSILMAVSAAFTYKIVSLSTTGFVGRTRNLAASFLVMGYVFAPQLFNPFLNKDRVAIL